MIEIDDVRDEIEFHFANGSSGHAYAIRKMPQEKPAWVIRAANGQFGVAVPYNGEKIFERFAGAVLKSVEGSEYGYSLPDVLTIMSAHEASRNEFSLLCADFVDASDTGQRENLQRNPRGWWERWKGLLGNHVREKAPQGVLGELLVYYYLLGTDAADVQWGGPSAASHDFHTRDFDIEVKTTLKRYGYKVHIAGQYQLQNQGVDLSLVFCRLEPHPNGFSINDLVRMLVEERGVDRDTLETKLSSLGYDDGTRARRDPYVLQEMRIYHVDDDFPRITPDSFKTGALPAGVEQISYDVELEQNDGELILPEVQHSARSEGVYAD